MWWHRFPPAHDPWEMLRVMHTYRPLLSPHSVLSQVLPRQSTQVSLRPTELPGDPFSPFKVIRLDLVSAIEKWVNGGQRMNGPLWHPLTVLASPPLSHLERAQDTHQRLQGGDARRLPSEPRIREPLGNLGCPTLPMPFPTEMPADSYCKKKTTKTTSRIQSTISKAHH